MAIGRTPENLSNLEKQLRLIQDQTTEALKLAGVYDTMFNTINKVNEGLKGSIGIQATMLKGQSASKQIDEGLLNNKAKQQALLSRVKAMKKAGLKYDIEDLSNERKKLQVEKEILKEQEKLKEKKYHIKKSEKRRTELLKAAYVQGIKNLANI